MDKIIYEISIRICLPIFFIVAIFLSIISPKFSSKFIGNSFRLFDQIKPKAKKDGPPRSDKGLNRNVCIYVGSCERIDIEDLDWHESIIESMTSTNRAYSEYAAKLIIKCILLEYQGILLDFKKQQIIEYKKRFLEHQSNSAISGDLNKTKKYTYKIDTLNLVLEIITENE